MPSNRLLFSNKLFLDAVSVNSFQSSLDGDFVGDLGAGVTATGVTVTVFSVLQVLAGTSGFSLSGDVRLLRAGVTYVRAGFGGPSGSALASAAASAAFCGLTN